jgi:hypothetical protein
MVCGLDPCFDPYKENSLCKKTNVSFGIFGDKLDPNELTERTSVKPSRGLSKGQRIYRSERAGGGFYPAAQGVWQICSDTTVESSSTEVHAQYILDLLEPHFQVVEQFLNRPGYLTVINIWWQTDQGHGGFSMRATTLARLCRLCDRIDTHFLGGVYPQESGGESGSSPGT